MSVWSIVNELRDKESVYACIAVQDIQTGHDPQSAIRRAGAYRAERYEFRATGEVLHELHAERAAEIVRRADAATARFRDALERLDHPNGSDPKA